MLSPAICLKRGIHTHCDKVCFFYHRELCPPYLLDKRDKLIKEREQEKQHHGMDYVDEDTDSEDYMQLGDTPNCFSPYMDNDHHKGKDAAPFSTAPAMERNTRLKGASTASITW